MRRNWFSFFTIWKNSLRFFIILIVSAFCSQSYVEQALSQEEIPMSEVEHSHAFRELTHADRIGTRENYFWALQQENDLVVGLTKLQKQAVISLLVSFEPTDNIIGRCSKEFESFLNKKRLCAVESAKTAPTNDGLRILLTECRLSFEHSVDSMLKKYNLGSRTHYCNGE